MIEQEPTDILADLRRKRDAKRAMQAAPIAPAEPLGPADPNAAGKALSRGFESQLAGMREGRKGSFPGFSPTQQEKDRSMAMVEQYTKPDSDPQILAGTAPEAEAKVREDTTWVGSALLSAGRGAANLSNIPASVAIASGDTSPTTIQQYVINRYRRASQSISPGAKAVQEAEGISGLGKLAMERPGALAQGLGDIMGESIGGIAPGILTAPFTGTLGIGANSAAVEFDSAFDEQLRAVGIDPTNYAVMLDIVNKEPEVIAAAARRASKRAAIVGGFDTLTAGAAGRIAGIGGKVRTLTPALRAAVTRPVNVARQQLVRHGEEVAVEAAGGMLGEATAQLGAEGRLDTKEVALEGIAEVPGAIPQTMLLSAKSLAGKSPGQVRAANKETIDRLAAEIIAAKKSTVDPSATKPATEPTASPEAEAYAAAAEERLLGTPAPTAPTPAATTDGPIPDWMRENAKAAEAELVGSGLAEAAEGLFAERYTAKEVANTLGVDIQTVLGFRIARGIPPQTIGGPMGSGSTVNPDFEVWLKAKQEGRIPAPAAPAADTVDARESGEADTIKEPVAPLGVFTVEDWTALAEALKAKGEDTGRYDEAAWQAVQDFVDERSRGAFTPQPGSATTSPDLATLLGGVPAEVAQRERDAARVKANEADRANATLAFEAQRKQAANPQEPYKSILNPPIPFRGEEQPSAFKPSDWARKQGSPSAASRSDRERYRDSGGRSAASKPDRRPVKPPYVPDGSLRGLLDRVAPNQEGESSDQTRPTSNSSALPTQEQRPTDSPSGSPDQSQDTSALPGSPAQPNQSPDQSGPSTAQTSSADGGATASASPTTPVADGASASSSSSTESKPEKEPAKDDGESVTQRDGTAKETGAREVKQLRALYKEKRSGWHYAEDENGAALVHPTEDRVVRFIGKQGSGTAKLSARARATVFAEENPVIPAAPAPAPAPAPKPAATASPREALLKELSGFIEGNDAKPLFQEWIGFLGTADEAGFPGRVQNLRSLAHASNNKTFGVYAGKKIVEAADKYLVSVTGKSGDMAPETTAKPPKTRKPVKKPEPAKAPAPPTTPKYGKQIGTNAEGKPLYEDDRGVRSYSSSGVIITESVKMIPTRAGIEIAVDKDARGRDYLTKEEYEAKNPPKAEKPAADPQPDPTPTPTQAPAAKPSVLTPEEQARKAELIARLQKKLNTELRSGFDPEMFAIGAELTSIYIKEGVKKFGVFARKMVADIGDAVKPYVKSFYNAARSMPGVDKTGMDEAAAVEAMDIETLLQESDTEEGGEDAAADEKSPAERVGEYFFNGGKFATIVDARKFVAGIEGGGKAKGGTLDAKAVEETVEHGVTLAARWIIEKGGTPQEIYAALVDLYGRQPKLSTRTGQSMLLQAYSTPVPLAFVAARLAQTKTAKSVYEPTAGTGMLLIDAEIESAIVNELDADRAKILRDTGFTVTEKDGAATAPPDKSVDAIIANPPFGTVPDPAGGNQRWAFGKGRTDQIDQAIIAKALQSMKDTGRAVFIVGSKRDMKTGEPNYKGKSVPFYRWLYSNFNVTDHFSVSGDLYTKQGAGFPVDVIVIEGIGRSKRPFPAVEAPRMYESWDTLGNEVLREEQDTGDTGGSNTNGDGGSSTKPNDDGSNDVSGGSQGQTGKPDSGKRKPGGRSPAPGGRGGGGASTKGGGSGGSRGGTTGGGRGVGKPDTDNANKQRGSVGGLQKPVSRGVVGGSKPALLIDPQELEETPSQVRYEPLSKDATGVGTVVPRQHADAIADAFADLKEEVGDPIEFVAKELGWTVDQAKEFLGAEQMDAVALAIYQAKNGNGMVLGDQTGIGKGRVVATMLQWARKAGKVPVFVTQDAKLYGDMLRDLEDTGQPDAMLLPTNAGLTGKNKLTSANGNAVESVPNAVEAVKEMARNLTESRYLAVATTYSQLQGASAMNRRLAMLEIAPNAFFILDESHNAGGTEMTEREATQQQRLTIEKWSRSYFVRKLLLKADSVLYSSATWSKRPGTMDLYAKTYLRYAVDDIANLGQAVKNGGVALQQIISKELVRLGQYIRRERSFNGIEYKTEVVKAPVETVGEITGIYARVVAMEPEAQKAAEAWLKTRPDVKQDADDTIGKKGAESTNFTSQIGNAISQMNLSAKVDASIDFAVKRLQAGERVVIALENTMESLIESSREAEGAGFGAPADVSFANRLVKYLDRSIQVRITEPQDDGSKKTTTETVPREFWSEELVQQYDSILATIKALDTRSMPVSPIDWIIMRLTAAGYKAGEITGRSEILKYSQDGSAVFANRGTDERSQVGQQRTIKGFQNGEIDVVILNASGATGISLHADRFRAKDQRPRRMLILQAIRNIDVFMQALGRIHRTGQVVRPAYSMLISNIPSEKRPAALLMKKMASLNANVSASRGGDVSFDAPDLLNEVGDVVVEQWVNANGEVVGQMYPDGDIPEVNEHDPGEFAQKITGRMALLPLDVQDEAWTSLASAFKSELDILTAAGENPLEVQHKDLRAEVVRALPWLGRRVGPPSWFTGAAYFEQIKIKIDVKPKTAAELVEESRRKMGVDTASQIVQEWDRQVRKWADDGMDYARERAAKMADSEVAQRYINEFNNDATEFTEQMRAVVPGRFYDHPKLGALFVKSIENRDVTKSPIARSRFIATCVMPDERDTIYVQVSNLGEMRPDYGGVQAEQFDEFASNPHSLRWVGKGNLLQAWEGVGREKSPGMYTLKYTDNKGNEAIGIMFPRNWPDSWFEGKSKGRQTVLKDSADGGKLLLQFGNLMLVDADGILTIQEGHTGEFVASLPPDRRSSAKYLAIRAAAKAAKSDFVRRNSAQTMWIEKGRIEAVVEAFADAGIRFTFKGATGIEESPSTQRQLEEAARLFGSQDPLNPNPPGGSGGGGPAPDSFSRSASLGDRMERWAGEVENRLRNRFRRKAGIDRAPGAPMYLNSGVDPSLYVDLAGWLAFKTLKVGIRKGRELHKYVDELVSDLRTRGSTLLPSTMDRDSVLKLVKSMIKEAGGDVDAIPGVAAEITEALARKSAANLKAEGASEFTKARDKAASERPAIKSRTAKLIRKMVNAARQDEQNQAVDKLNRVVNASRRQAAMFRIEQAAAIKNAKELQENEERDAHREAIRNEVVLLLEDSLPFELRSPFLNAAANAKTYNDVRIVAGRAVRRLVRHVAKRAWNTQAAFTKWAHEKRLTPDQRADVDLLLNESKRLMRQMNTRGVTTADLMAMRDTIVANKDAMLAIHAAAKKDRLKRAAAFRKKVENLSTELAANVNSAKKPIPRDAEMVETPETSMRGRIIRGLSNIVNTSTAIEGKVRGVIHRIMYDNLVFGENAKHAQDRDDMDALNTIMTNAGFAGLNDAIGKMSKRFGNTKVLWVKWTIKNGGVANLTLGQALGLAATFSDPGTRKLMAQGLPITFDSEKNRKFKPTIKELRRLYNRMDKEYPGLITAVKAHMHTRARPAFDVAFELNGWFPELVKAYWPRARNQQANPDKALPRGVREISRKYLENLGLLERRKEDPVTPLLISDFLTTAMEHMTNLSSLTHMALPVRVAAAVLESDVVKNAVVSRQGSKVYDYLHNHLSESSMANEDGGNSSFGVKAVRGLSRNVAVAWLATNIKSMLTNLGGTFRLVPWMGKEYVSYGVAHVGEVTMEQLSAENGYFWKRYHHGGFERFSPVLSVAAASDQSSIKESLSLTVANLKAGDFRGAKNTWGAAQTASMGLYNQFDGWMARVAVMGNLKRSRDLHPKWSEAEHRRWAISEAERIYRITQNPSSASDMSHLALRARRSVLGVFMMFSSDRQSAHNAVRRGINEGVGKSAIAAETANMMWARGLTVLFTALPMMLGKLLGDDDEPFEELVDAPGIATDTLVDVLTLLVPVAGGPIKAAARELRGESFGSSITDNPLGDSIDGGLDSMGSLIRADDGVEAFKAVNRGIDAVSTLVGDPTLALRRLLTRTLEAAMDSENNDIYH